MTVVASVWLTLSCISAAIVAWDLARGHRQHMWIMNVVWPVTMLWAGPLGLWPYYRYGRAGEESAHRRAETAHTKPPNVTQPFSILVAKSTSHCGAGCALGDVVGEGLMMVAPLTLFGHRLFGSWTYGLVLAFVFGIAFQYFTIAPMRGLTPWRGLKAAVKADALSLLAWQVGMYGWMALVTFAFFHRELEASSPLFWFMMQIAMIAGFATSYPVNRWLLRQGLKEKM